MRKGGFELQINVVDSQTLRDAQQHPERHRDLMVRVGPEAYQRSLAKPHARPMDFTGKPLRGMIYVACEGFEDDSDLDSWVKRGIDFAGSLPPKTQPTPA